jgi:hypothetical protein
MLSLLLSLHLATDLAELDLFDLRRIEMLL